MRWFILVLAPLLPAAATLDNYRFEARGADPPWSLKINRNAISLINPYYVGKLEGRVVNVDRRVGHVLISAMIVVEEYHPLGNIGRGGEPIFTVSTSEERLAIEVVERACVDAKRHIRPTEVVVIYRDEAPLRGCGGSLAASKSDL